jgi:hypothetical protein
VIGTGGAELWRVALALLALALVAWVPGLALHRLLLPGRGRLEAVAAAPALSVGMLYCLGELLSQLGARVDARLAIVLLLGGLLALGIDLRRRGLGPAPPSLVSGAVGLAVGVGTLIWCLGIRHLLAVPPHNDGYNHGFFVRRIADTHSLDPSIVMPHDVLLGGHGVDYYPLALHQLAAVLVQVLHLDVAVAWTLTSLVITVVALPIGMLALGRRLFPGEPRVAAACALVAALMPGLTYSTSWWGGYALAAGFAAAPGALLLALSATESWRARSLFMAALGLAGVAGMHTSEYSFLAALAGVLVLSNSLRLRSPRALVGPALRLAAVGALSLLLLAPAVAQMQRGLDERAYPVPTEGLSLGRAVGEVLFQHSFVPPTTPVVIPLITLAALVVCLITRRARGWVAAWALFAVLYIWLAAYPSGFIAALTATWYSDRFRIGYILAFLAIPFVAYAISGGTRASRRELRAAGPVLGVVLLVTSSWASVHAIRQNYQDFSLVGPQERQAFRFLATHVQPGDHVLNQHQDGSPWMYSLDGVAAMVTLKTFDFERPEWADANYLARHVQSAGHDPRVDALLARFKIRYVYLGPDAFPTEKPDLQRSALASSPALRVVFEAGRARVYEVVR